MSINKEDDKVRIYVKKDEYKQFLEEFFCEIGKEGLMPEIVKGNYEILIKTGDMLVDAVKTLEKLPNLTITPKDVTFITNQMEDLFGKELKEIMDRVLQSDVISIGDNIATLGSRIVKSVPKEKLVQIQSQLVKRYELTNLIQDLLLALI